MNRKRAAKRLGRLGVKVVTGAMVEHIDDGGVIVAGVGSIERGTVLWTAGVSPSPLVKMLGVAKDLPATSVSHLRVTLR